MDAESSLQSEIQDLNDMHVAYLEIFQNHFKTICKDIVEHSKDVPKDLDTFKQHILGFDEVEKKISALASAITDLDSHLPDDTDDFNQLCSRVDENFENYLRNQATYDRVELLINCVDNDILRLEEEAEADSTDILEVAATENYQDPLTKKTLTDPVKSASCGHTFERSTILKYLEKGQRCPYFGCVKPLARSDLVDDLKMKAKLRNLKEGL